MSGLAPVEEIATDPPVAVQEVRSVAELGIELAPAWSEGQTAERVGRGEPRLIVGSGQHQRQAAMLDAQGLSNAQPD